MPPVCIPLPSLAATEGLAARLAPHLRRGDVVTLQGPLGAGKTTFARTLLRVLGITSEVPSPTFTLMQIYKTKNFPAYHFDLYRLKSSDELDELGWDDAATDGVVLVEWPERAENRMPKNRLCLRFEMNDKSERRCIIEPHGEWEKRTMSMAS